MLPSSARLRRSRDFAQTVRQGARAGRPLLVVHLRRDPGTLIDSRPGTPARAGFVVSGAVGGSVVRHAVVRRLRHLVAARLDRLPAGSTLVVRALPPAATASSAALATDLHGALETALRRSESAPIAAGAAS